MHRSVLFLTCQEFLSCNIRQRKTIKSTPKCGMYENYILLNSFEQNLKRMGIR